MPCIVANVDCTVGLAKTVFGLDNSCTVELRQPNSCSLLGLGYSFLRVESSQNKQQN